MPDDRPKALYVACLLVLACGGTDASLDLDPRPASVTPGEGSATRPTAVVIHGSNFLLRTVQPASGGQPTIDAHHRAWLGSVELQDVVWVDLQTLQATVPAGAPAGPQRLVVENALGRRGELASAFVVRPEQPAALAVTAYGVSRSTLNVGQETAVTLSLQNTGEVAAAISASAAEMTAGSGTCGASSPPAPLSIAGGASTTFTWSCTPSAPGSVTVSATVAATDVSSGADVSPAPGAIPLTVQAPAALAVTSFLATSPVGIGQPSTITLALQNGGGATANVTAIVPSVNLGSQSAGLCGAASPAPPRAIAGGATVPFTWTCTPSAIGSVVAGAAVSAVDSNSGADVSPTVPSVGIAVTP